MKFQSEQISILLISLVLCVGFYAFSRKFKYHDKEAPLPRPLVLGVLYVRFIDNYTADLMGPKIGGKMSAYIGAIFIYILLANFSGLIGLDSPTGNWSVTIALALVTWVWIQFAKFKSLGFKGYIKDLFQPFFFFFLPNVLGAIAPLISLSLRLFGNVLAGGVILGLVYTFTNWLSSFVPVIGDLNFIGAAITPLLHLYFDVFSGFIQAFVFVTLSVILIGIEYGEEK